MQQLRPQLLRWSLGHRRRVSVAYIAPSVEVDADIGSESGYLRDFPEFEFLLFSERFNPLDGFG